MSIIFDQLVTQAGYFEDILEQRLKPKDEEHDFPWINRVYESDKVRRAHLDIVDKREDRKLFMMHLCVFPNTKSLAPIYGFDLIAGPNKVTGAFHDFSPCNNPRHPLNKLFIDKVSSYSWSKERELPDWAKAIFSPRMIAAGNIKDSDELTEILTLSIENLVAYLDYMESEPEFDLDSTEYQNRYCHFQKQNPHTPRVMESLGYEPEMVQKFIHTCLFPEI